MINYIWAAMIIISFFAAAINGNINAVTSGALNGAAEAVSLLISLLGIMALWTGLAKIAEKSGLVRIFSKLLRPITKRLFPRLKEGGAAMEKIVMNMVANLLGMGNAATPLGLSAMKELDALREGEEASDEMCTFAVLNTASLQLIPSTIISLRHAFGSKNPSIIILPVWLVSTAALLAALISSKIFEKRRRN